MLMGCINKATFFTGGHHPVFSAKFYATNKWGISNTYYSACLCGVALGKMCRLNSCASFLPIKFLIPRHQVISTPFLLGQTHILYATNKTSNGSFKLWCSR